MKEFRVTLSNRPGELGRVSTALSRQGVSLKAVAATSAANQVVVHFVGHDVTAIRAGLESASIPFEEEEVLLLLLEDKAGEIARIAAQLGEQGVNITAIYLAGRADDLVEVIVATDDVKKAKKILGDQTL
ncbi:MAG: hypothetical protein JXP34_24340 [Planctomycetes bacterium]|nr:hypothetical protein [Planctomycetota bacterium]